MFEGKTALITGGTGSLGRALTKKLLVEELRGVEPSKYCGNTINCTLIIQIVFLVFYFSLLQKNIE